MLPDSEHSARRVDGVALNQSRYYLCAFRCAQTIHACLYRLYSSTITSYVKLYFAVLRFFYAFLSASDKLSVDLKNQQSQQCRYAYQQRFVLPSLVSQDDPDSFRCIVFSYIPVALGNRGVCICRAGDGRLRRRIRRRFQGLVYGRRQSKKGTTCERLNAVAHSRTGPSRLLKNGCSD